MATITFPSGLKTGAVSYGVQFDVQITTSRNGKVFSYGLPGHRWLATINFEAELERAQRPQIEALIMSLQGGINRLQMHHFGRPIPNGTLRGTPTLAGALAVGAQSMTIANANGTVKRGDILGLPGQLMMVLADATPVASNMTVAFAPALRTAYNSGTAVAWNKPTTLWIPTNSSAGPFPYAQGGLRPGISLELVEAP